VPIGYSLMALLVIIRLLAPRRAPAAPASDTHS